MTDIIAGEVLDSWARSTFAVTLTLDHTTTARAGVRLEASTGPRVAAEGATAPERHGG